jgi:hypothetical protein
VTRRNRSAAVALAVTAAAWTGAVVILFWAIAAGQIHLAG